MGGRIGFEFDVELSARALTELKYPVIHATLTGVGHKYPTGSSVSEIAVWIDALDLYLETKSVIVNTGTRPANPFGL